MKSYTKWSFLLWWFSVWMLLNDGSLHEASTWCHYNKAAHRTVIKQIRNETTH